MHREPDRTRLKFWHWIASAETAPGADTARVLVDGRVVWQIDLSRTSTTPGWELVAIDLAAEAGQTATLRFEVATDSAGTSSWLIDDVALSQ